MGQFFDFQMRELSFNFLIFAVFAKPAFRWESPTVLPTSTVSYSDGTTISTRKDLAEEFNEFENPMPFIGEIIKKLTSKFLQGENSYDTAIMFSNGSFEGNSFDPLFVGEMGVVDDWLQKRIDENELFATKMEEERKIKEENEKFRIVLARRRQRKIACYVLLAAVMLGFCLGSFFILIRVYLYRRNHPRIGILSSAKFDAEKQPLILA